MRPAEIRRDDDESRRRFESAIIRRRKLHLEFRALAPLFDKVVGDRIFDLGLGDDDVLARQVPNESFV